MAEGMKDLHGWFLTTDSLMHFGGSTALESRCGWKHLQDRTVQTTQGSEEMTDVSMKPVQDSFVKERGFA